MNKEVEMYKGVLFDLDGTLLDTSKGVKKSVLYTIDKMGLPQISNDEISPYFAMNSLFSSNLFIISI